MKGGVAKHKTVVEPAAGNVNVLMWLTAGPALNKGWKSKADEGW